MRVGVYYRLDSAIGRLIDRPVSKLYRFGFLFSVKNHRPKELPRDWKRQRVRGHYLYTHRETTWRLIGDVLLVGTVIPLRGTVEEAASARLWDNLTGRFAAIVLDEKPYVVQDAFGAQTVFYRDKGKAIASHAGLLAAAYGHSRNKVAADFIKTPEYKSRSVCYLPGLMTMHEGIKPLIPNHTYGLRSGEITRIWPLKERRSSTFDEFFNEFTVLLDAMATVDRPILGVTGGIDTRVLVAGLSSRNVPIRTVTWSPPRIDKKEIPIVENTVKVLGLNHVWLLHEADRADPIAVVSGQNSGGFRGGSRITADTARLFSEGTFVRGYGGEIIRGFYNLRNRKMTGSNVGEMVEAYGSSMREKNPSAEYLRVVTEAFEEYSDICDYSDLRGFNPNDVFYWEHRMGVWGACMHNEMDAAVYNMTGINSRPLFEVSYGLPDEERLTKHLLNRIVISQVPAMADVKVV